MKPERCMFKSNHKCVQNLPKYFSPAYLIILAIDQSQFKLELCRVNSKNSGFTLTIKTVHTAPLENKYK